MEDIEKEGGQILNEIEAINLKNKVNFEIGSHDRVKLTNNEIFYYYWCGSPFKTSG
jgi:hypothetical protein